MRLLPVPFLMLLSACTASRVALPPPTGDEVTVFIHGYRGSFLATADAEHERAWVSVGDLLTRGERSLALPFPGQRATPTFGALEVDGPMTRFTVLPWVARYDIYKGFLEFARERLPGFMVFDYDWRQDNRVTAKRLCALLDELAAARGGRVKVNLVAHSMGGLVTLHCLRYGTGDDTGEPTWAGARHVKRVVFLGTPFRGAPGMFDDFTLGTPMGRNRALLSPEALFTFASAFQLLPSESDFFVDASGQPVAFDAYRPDAWVDGGWGVFQDAAVRELPAYRQWLERMLEARSGLARALSERGGPPPPFRTLAVVGVGHPLIKSFRVIDGKPTFEDPVLADGDGSVLTTRALPPAPLHVDRLETKADHVAMVGDEEVMEAVARFVTGD
ncbi:alpha/beta fold hydrolase [Corallococcus exercitus]|uniref:Alpha/beta fold hydrolase n=1 Tax=Corallococcus exercitus TaxID=2316736 RepID=A0A7Y4KQR9_9BACT|nr:alpha/beta fold hydrolase [Corallococcus exercitus]NOK38200.1 alpha/beta fold hydrolase [Corallococcus exercitus]